MPSNLRNRIQQKLTQLIENSTDTAEILKLIELYQSLKPPSKQSKPKLDKKLADILK